MAAAMMGLSFLFLLLVFPHYLQISKDFKVDLPWWTQDLSDLGYFMFAGMDRIIISAFIWLILMAAVVVVPLFIPAPSNRTVRKSVEAAICVLVILIPAVVAVASIGAPMIALHQSVSGPQGGKK